jgi:hypothetical protein
MSSGPLTWKSTTEIVPSPTSSQEKGIFVLNGGSYNKKKIQSELNFRKPGFELSSSYIFLDIRAETWFVVVFLLYTEHPQ